MDDVDVGGVGVDIEVCPVGFQGGDAVAMVLDLCAEGSGGACISVFVVGVDSKMDGHSEAFAEIEQEQRRRCA